MDSQQRVMLSIIISRSRMTELRAEISCLIESCLKETPSLIQHPDLSQSSDPELTGQRELRSLRTFPAINTMATVYTTNSPHHSNVGTNGCCHLECGQDLARGASFHWKSVKEAESNALYF